MYTPSRWLRSSSAQLLSVPRVHLKSAGERSFSFHQVPQVWNLRPREIQPSPPLPSIKQNLKKKTISFVRPTRTDITSTLKFTANFLCQRNYLRVRKINGLWNEVCACMMRVCVCENDVLGNFLSLVVEMFTYCTLWPPPLPTVCTVSGGAIGEESHRRAFFYHYYYFPVLQGRRHPVKSPRLPLHSRLPLPNDHRHAVSVLIPVTGIPHPSRLWHFHSASAIVQWNGSRWKGLFSRCVWKCSFVIMSFDSVVGQGCERDQEEEEEETLAWRKGVRIGCLSICGRGMGIKKSVHFASSKRASTPFHVLLKKVHALFHVHFKRCMHCSSCTFPCAAHMLARCWVHIQS